jgi:hypothetical protein
MGSIKCVCRERDAISAVEYEVAQCDEYLKMEKFRFVGFVVEPVHLSSSFYCTPHTNTTLIKLVFLITID